MPAPQLKILMILVEPPLPFGNAASRWFHVLLKGLRKRNHTVDVLVASAIKKDIDKAQQDFKNDPHFFIYPFGKNTGIFSKLKTFLFPHAYMFNGPFSEKLQSLDPNKYDIIHVEQTWGGWSALKWTHKSLINVHHLQMIDLEYIKHRHWKSFLMYKSWFWAEQRILTKYPFVRTCSPRLEPYVKSWGQKKLVTTVPVSLDLSLYKFIEPHERQTAQPIVTVIGNMTWYPSISAAQRLLKNLWPAISEQIPHAKIRVVGWSARTALAEHLNTPGVEIFENVADIQPYFNEASLMIYAPSRGSGMKIKILESMAYGVPIVTTSEGAEGLPAIDMTHMGICDDDQGLIDRSVKILKDPILQESLRKNARTLLAEHCGEDQTVSAIEKMYEHIIKSQD